MNSRVHRVAIIAAVMTAGSIILNSPVRGQSSQPEEMAAPVEGVHPDMIPDELQSRFEMKEFEVQPNSDVLVLKDGRRVEVYFLRAYGDELVFFVKHDDVTFARERLRRSDVRTVLLGESLERDPLAPPQIRRARKQPVVKRNILAGAFTGRQDASTQWHIRFRSSINKQIAFSEDATEFGTVEIESVHVSQDRRHKSSTWSMGRYHLYAPGSVNNEDWVLTLSSMTHSQRDAGRHTNWSTGRLADDTLIVTFADTADSFRLEWSNLSSGTWTSLPQITFRRMRARGHSPGGPHRGEPTRVPLQKTLVRLREVPQGNVMLGQHAAPKLAAIGGSSGHHVRLTTPSGSWIVRQPQERSMQERYRLAFLKRRAKNDGRLPESRRSVSPLR